MSVLTIITSRLGNGRIIGRGILHDETVVDNVVRDDEEMVIGAIMCAAWKLKWTDMTYLEAKPR